MNGVRHLARAIRPAMYIYIDPEQTRTEIVDRVVLPDAPAATWEQRQSREVLIVTTDWLDTGHATERWVHEDQPIYVQDLQRRWLEEDAP